MIIDFINLVCSIIMVCIAFYALQSWKNEFKEKRQYEVARQLYFCLIKLELFYIKNIKGRFKVQNELIINHFDIFYETLNELLLEFQVLEIQSELYQSIQYFIELTNTDFDKAYEADVDEDGYYDGNFRWENFEDIDLQKEFEAYMKKLKDYCKQKIYKFYK